MPNPNERRPARKPDPKAANARRDEKSRSAPRKGPAPARVAALEALMDVQISQPPLEETVAALYRKLEEAEA